MWFRAWRAAAVSSGVDGSVMAAGMSSRPQSAKIRVRLMTIRWPPDSRPWISFPSVRLDGDDRVQVGPFRERVGQVRAGDRLVDLTGLHGVQVDAPGELGVDPCPGVAGPRLPSRRGHQGFSFSRA
jgi:hypothetical protein